MRACRAYVLDASSSDDERALCLLNKLLGAQILVQCTEPIVSSQTPALVETVVTEQRSQDGKVNILFDFVLFFCVRIFNIIIIDYDLRWCKLPLGVLIIVQWIVATFPISRISSLFSNTFFYCC